MLTFNWPELLLRAAEIGVPPERFWSYTPAELGLLFQAEQKRREREAEIMIAQAWYVERFQRERKLRSLSYYLPKEQHSKKQTPEDMLRIVEMINTALGGEDLRQ